MAINIVGLVGIIIFYVVILVIGLWAARKRDTTRDKEGDAAGKLHAFYISPLSIFSLLFYEKVKHVLAYTRFSFIHSYFRCFFNHM